MPSTKSEPGARAARRRPAERTGRAGGSRVPHHRKKEVLGLILITVALLLTIAVVTYAPQDDALARRSALDALVDAEQPQALNRLGLVGAQIARVLVPSFLGYPVLLFTLLLMGWGYAIFRSRPPAVMPWVTALTVYASLLASAFSGWMTLVGEMDLSLWSGAVGLGVAGWLRHVLGSIGSFLILQLFALILVLLIVDRDIQGWLDRIEGAVLSVLPWTQDRLARWRERRDARRAEYARLREARRQEREAAPAPREEIRPPVRTGDGARGPAPAVRPARPEPPPFRPEPDEDEPDEFLPPRPVERPRPVEPRTGPGASAEPPEPRPEAAPAQLALTVRERVEEQKVNLDERNPDAPPAEIPYRFPSVELLEDEGADGPHIDYEELEENKQVLLDKLDTYNIKITDIDAVVGPTVTLYELTPAPGVKISRITALEDDLAMAMAARGIRMIAPIPGKSAIGVEIPNRHREFVRIRSLLNTARFRDSKMELPFVMGKTIEGEVYIEDLTKMPHLLIAGATGSGKSVGLNTLIIGLLYACHPANLKFVLIDPKKVEMAQYANILNHFIAMPEGGEDPIITDFMQAIAVLKSCEKEMEQRYDLLSAASVRSVKDYNKKIREGKLDAALGHRHLPYIVVVIDELADLMMVSGKEIEGPIARLAQMARAVGVHLVLATQRPSVDVITGLIKANFPARVAFQVASKIDSRTILDQGGAEGLVGNGDLLYMNGARIVRLQGPFISVEEVEEVTTFIGRQSGGGAYALPRVEAPEVVLDEEALSSGEIDDLFEEAARIIVRSQQGSVSLLQRKLSIGYTRAARIVDQLEEAGIVGPFEGSRARAVLVESEAQLDELLRARE